MSLPSYIQVLLWEGKIQEALENVGQTYEERINAKYDTELTELENKKRHKSEVTADMKAQEPTETPKLEALKAKPTEALKDVQKVQLKRWMVKQKGYCRNLLMKLG